MRYIPLILTLLTLFSCSHGKYNPELLNLEEYIEERPDSVLPILEAFDTSEISTPSRALHAYLLSRARHKCDIVETDDSLISFAVRTFQKHNDRRHLMKASFIQGYINLNAEMYPEAINLAMESEALSRENDDFEYQARSNQLIADIFNATGNTGEALRYNKKAVDLYKKIGFERESKFAEADYAIAHHNIGNDSIALKMLQELIPLIDRSDTLLRAYAMEYLAVVQQSLNLMDDLELTNTTLNDLPESGSDLTKLFITIDIALAHDNIAKAESLLDSIYSIHPEFSNNNKTLEALYIIQIKKGLFREALKTQDQIISNQNKFVNQALQQNVSRMISEQLANTAQKQQDRAEKLLLILVVFAIIVLITLIFAWYLHKSRIRIIRLEIERVKQEMQSIKLQSKTVSKKESPIQQFFIGRFSNILELCDELDRPHTNSKRKDKILVSIKSELESMQDPSMLKDLELIIDQSYNNAATLLSEEMSELKPKDRAFLILSFAGISSNLMQAIFKMEQANFYMKRSRLKKKIANSDIPDKELFLSLLE